VLKARVGRRVGYSNRYLYLWQTILIAILLAVWEFAAKSGWIDAVLIGSPSGVYRYLIQEIPSGTIGRELLWTMSGALIAFAIGSGLAICTGLMFVAWPFAERLLSPLLSGLNAMPRIALAPLFIIWFGLGLGSKVAMGASLTYFIVLSSTVAGARMVSQEHLILSTTLGASPSQRFFTFVLPSAVPSLFSGLRLGLIYSLLGVVGAELIASEHGLGQVLSLLAAGFKTSGVLAILLVLALVGTAISAGMSYFEQHLLRWR
jgi:NitT/TauT family transport system permease protein